MVAGLTRQNGGGGRAALADKDSHVRGGVDAEIYRPRFLSRFTSDASHSAEEGRGGENILRGLSACRKTNDPRGKTARTKAENGRFVASTADRLRNGRSTRKRPRSSSPLPLPPSSSFRYARSTLIPCDAALDGISVSG